MVFTHELLLFFFVRRKNSFYHSTNFTTNVSTNVTNVGFPYTGPRRPKDPRRKGFASFARVYTSSSAPQCERIVPPWVQFLRSGYSSKQRFIVVANFLIKVHAPQKNQSVRVRVRVRVRVCKQGSSIASHSFLARDSFLARGVQGGPDDLHPLLLQGCRRTA